MARRRSSGVKAAAAAAKIAAAAAASATTTSAATAPAAAEPSSPTAFQIAVGGKSSNSIPEDTVENKSPTEEEKAEEAQDAIGESTADHEKVSEVENDVTMAEAGDEEKNEEQVEEGKKMDVDTEEKKEVEEENKEEEKVEEEIFPDHYWGDGKIPVFKPTMDQFRSFKEFVDKIDHYGMQSGIVKIIPPKEWRDSLPDISDKVKSIRVKNPIEQHIAGMSGTYRQTNLEKQKTYNLPQWKNACESSDHQPPARRGERRRNQEAKPVKGSQSRAARASRRAAVKEEDEEPTPNPPTPPSPDHAKNEDEVETPEKPTGGRMLRTRKKYHKKTKEEMEDALVKDHLWDGFDYHLDNVNEFTPERCEELERAYWRTLTYNSPMYGADMPGSLFDETTTSWNVAKLENILDCLGKKLPGVNTAYLYLGMWKATFSWHLEDVDLYSINYIHFGAPKQWYSISQEDLPKFESIMKSIWPNEAKKCSQFLRHKTFLVSPSLLEQRGLKVNRLVHYEGEFVITFPFGYHSGYNLGYNCAESVNFATEAWLNYGRTAKRCECIDDAVWVDVDEIERKLQGLPTEDEEDWDDEDEDENDDSMIGDLPTPPESVGEVAARVVRRGAPQPKKKKKIKGEGKAAVKSVKLKLNAPRDPCVLCPNDRNEEPVLKTDSGRGAHRLCAIYTPETYFQIDPETEEEIVCNVDGIPKARLQLKCYFCRSKKGACFQCSEGKCVRAYHATCAASAGVLVDMRDIEVVDANGNTTMQPVIDFKCRFHRPKRNRDWDGLRLEGIPSIRFYARSMLPGDLVQAQFYRGDIFAGVIKENRTDEETLVMDVVPSGGLVEVEYKWVLPNETVLSNFSSDLRPVQASFTAETEITTRLQPRIGDQFHPSSPNLRWAEFNTMTPTGKKKKNFVQENVKKYFFYLPDQSTEYVSKYSADPSSQVPADEANMQPTKKVRLSQANEGVFTPNKSSRSNSNAFANTTPLNMLSATAAAAIASAESPTTTTPPTATTPQESKMPKNALHTNKWQQPSENDDKTKWSQYEPRSALPWLTPQFAQSVGLPNSAPASAPGAAVAAASAIVNQNVSTSANSSSSHYAVKFDDFFNLTDNATSALEQQQQQQKSSENENENENNKDNKTASQVSSALSPSIPTPAAGKDASSDIQIPNAPRPADLTPIDPAIAAAS